MLTANKHTILYVKALLPYITHLLFLLTWTFQILELSLYPLVTWKCFRDHAEEHS